MDHFRGCQARLAGNISLPDGTDMNPGGGVVNFHVPGQQIGQRAHISGALNVVLTP